jgi:PH domain
VTVYPSEVQASTVRIKEGYIKKWVNLVSGFKKRYFVLTRDLLVYYKEKKGLVSEKGQISIKLARVDPRNMNDRKMIIATGTNEIHLEFQSVDEKREWLQAIDQCKRALHYADMPQYHHEEAKEEEIKTGNGSAGK